MYRFTLLILAFALKLTISAQTIQPQNQLSLMISDPVFLDNNRAYNTNELMGPITEIGIELNYSRQYNDRFWIKGGLAAFACEYVPEEFTDMSDYNLLGSTRRVGFWGRLMIQKVIPLSDKLRFLPAMGGAMRFSRENLLTAPYFERDNYIVNYTDFGWTAEAGLTYQLLSFLRLIGEMDYSHFTGIRDKNGLYEDLFVPTRNVMNFRVGLGVTW